MQLYRVADSEDDGPYKGESRGGVPGVLDEHSRDRRGHPTPFEDPGIGTIRREREVCACTSLAALYQWFSGWADELTHKGYIVRVVDVPEEFVRVGSHGQAVYSREHAREIRAFPVSRHVHAYA